MKKINKKLIFLVEDSSDIRDLVKLLFEGEGYVVEIASNGQFALEKLRELKELPCFLLLDLMMPGMGGNEFRKLQEADAELASIPVVVITADAKAETKAIALGASGFIKKPVQLTALLEVARKFCSDT